MPNPLINKKVLFGGMAYDSIAVDYFNRAGINNTMEKNAVNRFVISCKSNPNILAAILTGLVYLVSPTSYGASVFNLINSSFKATSPVPPTFSTTGWSFDGVNQYINSNLTPSTTLTEDSHTTIIYNRRNVQHAGRDWGAIQTATARLNGATRLTSDEILFSCYDSANAILVANTDASGYFTWSILSSTSRLVRRSGLSLGTSAADISASSRPNVPIYIGAQDNGGSSIPSSPRSCEVASFVQTIALLSSSDSDELVGYLQTYNANVISGGR